MNSPWSAEYSGPYRWDEARERIPNDYGPPDSLHYKNYKVMSREEEAEYLDLLLSDEERGEQIIY